MKYILLTGSLFISSFGACLRCCWPADAFESRPPALPGNRRFLYWLAARRRHRNWVIAPIGRVFYQSCRSTRQVSWKSNNWNLQWLTLICVQTQGWSIYAASGECYEKWTVWWKDCRYMSTQRSIWNNQLTQTMQPSWVHAGFLEPLTLTKLLPIFTSLRLAMDIVSLSWKCGPGWQVMIWHDRVIRQPRTHRSFMYVDDYKTLFQSGY